MTEGTITCTCVEGTYKGKQIEIKIGPTGDTCKLFMDGKNLEGVLEAVIKIGAGEVTTVTLVMWDG